MTARTTKPPRFYFNLRSPYNFFALADLERDHPELLDRVEWRPFWEPDPTSEKLLTDASPGAEFPFHPMSRAKQFYILRDVRRLAADRGLALTWPVDRKPWWEPAHLTWFLAEREGLGRTWVERAGRARWLEGRDICDPDVVRELAEEIGLDGAEVDQAPTTRWCANRAYGRCSTCTATASSACRTSSTAASRTGAWTASPTSPRPSPPPPSPRPPPPSRPPSPPPAGPPT